MTVEDARARIAVQATPDRRAALADVVIHNDGDRDALRAQVDDLWKKLRA